MQSALTNGSNMKKKIAPISRAKEEKGASLVEYALLVSIIAVGAALAVSYLGNTIGTKYIGVAGNYLNT